MFEGFLSKLTGTDPEPLPDADARLALTALLVRVARSDNHYAPAERARIEQIVRKRYGLSEEATAELRADAETLEAEAPDTVRFTRAIKDAVAYDDRLSVVQAMWSVALADGDRADEEDALLRLVASLLGVTDTDNARARHRARAAMDG